MINEVPSSSVDITEQNIDKLKELFPEILTDGNKIDFDKLQLILGEEIDSEKERYSFNWPGKRETIIGAQQPSKGTLRPNVEKSKNFDTTENLYIEGDNLEVLKLLQKSYNNKIKVIYIDPPYNTGKDFVYKDNFRDGVNNYLEQTGQVDSEGNLLSTNAESNGRFHTDWLNMMYSRIKVARNLLTDDGVIFVSIDDNEQSNLKKICDEIFGENNKVAELIVIRAEGGGLAKQVIKGHDYLFVYAKDISNFIPLGRPKDIRGKIVERDGENYWIQEDWLRKEFGKYGNCHYEEVLEYKGEKTKKEIDEKLKSGEYILLPKKNGMHIVGKLREIKTDASKFYSVLKHLSANGIKDLEKLNLENHFDYPKPVSLIKEIILGATFFTIQGKDIILDFFSGSSTTAEAVMQLNSEDGGNRKFIMVQLPEILDAKSVAKEDGYNNICDIAIERIHRAGENIISENPENQENLDIGFKYLTLDKSNIKEWNTDFESLETELDLFEDVFVKERSELDIVYEIMLKNGLELTLPIDEFEVNGRKIYDIAFGHQFICLSDDIDTTIAQAIIDKRNEYGPEITSGVVFKDSGFSGDDSEKLNCIQLLKDAGFIEANLQTI